MEYSTIVLDKLLQTQIFQCRALTEYYLIHKIYTIQNINLPF